MEIVAACKLECHFYTCIFTNIMRSDICSEGNKSCQISFTNDLTCHIFILHTRQNYMKDTIGICGQKKRKEKIL